MPNDVTTTYFCFSLKSKIGSLEAENEVLRNRPVAVEHMATPTAGPAESKVQISRLHNLLREYWFKFLQASNVCRL